MLSHNYPSGSFKPSTADKELTQKLVNAARYHDIKVLDHVILDAEGRHLLFADEGLL